MRKIIDKTLASILIVLLGIMLFCVVWQVSSRYILGSGSNLTEEISRFGLIWLALIGAGYITGLKKHLAIDILLVNLPHRMKLVCSVVIEIAVVSFALIVLFYGGGDLVLKTLAKGQVSPMLNVKMAWIYAVIPFSGLIISYYSLINICDLLKLKNTERA